MEEVKSYEREECQVMIREKQLKQVDTMKYLGVMISGDGSMKQEAKTRIGHASRVIGGRSHACRQLFPEEEELSEQTKFKVPNVNDAGLHV